MFNKSSSKFSRRSFTVMLGFQHIIKERINYIPAHTTLILLGEHDIPLAHKMAGLWQREPGKSEFRIIPGAGHCANMDQPELFNAMVKDFFEKSK